MGTGRRRKKSSSTSAGDRATAQAGRASPGLEPPPTSPAVSTTSQGHRGLRASRRASARARSSAGSAESMADTGTAVPSRQSSRVASRAARDSLSMRRARARGSARSRPISSAFPSRIPAWGPPSSLSPEKQTTSAHVTASFSSGEPGAAEPRSQSRGTPRDRASSPSSGREADWVKPTTRKLLGWTLSMAWASPRSRAAA